MRRISIALLLAHNLAHHTYGNNVLMFISSTYSDVFSFLLFNNDVGSLSDMVTIFMRLTQICSRQMNDET